MEYGWAHAASCFAVALAAKGAHFAGSLGVRMIVAAGPLGGEARSAGLLEAEMFAAVPTEVGNAGCALEKVLEVHSLYQTLAANAYWVVGEKRQELKHGNRIRLARQDETTGVFAA